MNARSVNLTGLAGLAAALLVGLMAGFFFAFSVCVAPAMTRLDAPTYVLAQQGINDAVRNPTFFAVFFLAPVASVVAVGANWRSGRMAAFRWQLAGALIYLLGTFAVTVVVNVPINEALATWSPRQPPPEWLDARDRWNQASLARTVAAAVAFACLLAGLVASRPATE